MLDRDGVPGPHRAWKDVVNVRAGETVRIAVPLRGFTGRVVFHCHIAEHEQLGMTATLEVRPRGEPLGASLAPVELPPVAPAANDGGYGGGHDGGHGGGHDGH